MNITFLIGNGFDLACGLKTRYIDMYNDYCKTESKNENIADFKNEILGNYDTWSDFELALPSFGEKINNFANFSECVLDFTAFIDEYLTSQELLINVENHKHELENLMKKYTYQMFNYCLHQSKERLNKLISVSSENTTFNFITFNYTNTLEKCLSALKLPLRKNSNYAYEYCQPIHIHETLGNGILVGLDNENLYSDIHCEDKRELENLLNKFHRNSRYSNINNKVSNLLDNSNIIVIFGWSMGDSDSVWVESISNLFAKRSYVNLVYVPYFEELANKKFSHILLNREDKCKDYIMRKLNIDESEHARVHIVTNHDYINLSFLANNEDNIEEVKGVIA